MEIDLVAPVAEGDGVGGKRSISIAADKLETGRNAKKMGGQAYLLPQDELRFSPLVNDLAGYDQDQALIPSVELGNADHCLFAGFYGQCGLDQGC